MWYEILPSFGIITVVLTIPGIVKYFGHQMIYGNVSNNWTLCIVYIAGSVPCPYGFIQTKWFTNEPTLFCKSDECSSIILWFVYLVHWPRRN
jgi:hypothetical protein